MNKILYLFVFILFSAGNYGIAQVITAGSVTVNDNYFDVVPDSSFEALAVHLTPYPGGQMKIDIDQDGVADFNLSSGAGGGLGGGGGSCTITPLGSYATVASRNDTSQGCCPAQYVAQLADTIDFGDTIPGTRKYNSGGSYLWSTTYGWQQGPRINDWTNIGEHFIGVKLSYPRDTLYGWIRVEATGSNSDFTITIKDFACNKNPHLGINGVAEPLKMRLYPNPFANELRVECLNCGESEVSIFDVTCREILRQRFTDAVNLHMPNLESGIYLYEVRSKNKLIKTGKIAKE
jgi:hypothetical protein